MEKLLEMKHIYKFFGGLCAVNDVNFDLHKGEVVGLVGDNAAGKSTLMKILSGAYHATEGEIHFAGDQVKFRSPHDARNVGIEMLFQDLALVPELDVTDNLFLGKELYTSLMGLNIILDRKTMRSQSEGFLKQLGINIPSIHEKVRNLSGGQQQSVSIARTMFFEAKIVILDEPTSAISVKETQRVLDLILQLKEQDIGVIIVSHRMEDIFKVSDRIVVLRRGSKVEDIPCLNTTAADIIQKIIGGDHE